MRATSTATISFGLVSIPVKVYTGSENHAFRFNMLDPKTGSRVKQQYINPNGEVVPRNELVKGYEFSKGQYVTFVGEELKKLEALATKMIEVKEIVDLSAIDPMAIEKTHLLGPDTGGDKAYSLLMTVLAMQNKVAICQWNARGKEHLVMLRPVKGRLVMHQLLYAAEIRDPESVDVATYTFSEQEIDLAVKLVESLSNDKYDPTKYKDSQYDKVLAAVSDKVAGQDIQVVSDPGGAAVVDLFEALKKSLADVEKKPKKRVRTTKAKPKSKKRK